MILKNNKLFQIPLIMNDPSTPNEEVKIILLLSYLKILPIINRIHASPMILRQIYDKSNKNNRYS